MKKFLLSLLGVIISLPVVARDFNYDYQGQTLTYTVIDEDAKTCMTKAGPDNHTPGNNISGALVIPAKASDGINDYTVTTIGNYAFSNSELKSVSIPNTVKVIGNYAFYSCRSLSTATIPDQVEIIGAYAFYFCKKLSSVKIPDSVTSINDGTFGYCETLVSLEIPASVKNIGGGAFGDCTSLTTIVIPDSVTSMGVGVFYRCSSLKSVTLPKNIKSIGLNFFYGCTSLTSVIIPDSVASIGKNAFNGCSGLSSVIIPPLVSSIESDAFSGCSGLIKSAYPTSCSNPFPTGLSIAYEPKDATLEDGVVYGPGKSVIYFAPITLQGEFTIPASVTLIGDNSFCRCDDLKAVIAAPEVPPVMANNVFEGLYDTVVLNVTESSASDYLVTNWSMFKTIRFSDTGVESTVWNDGVLNYRLIPVANEDLDNLAVVIPGDYSNLTEVSVPQRFSKETGDGNIDRFYISAIGYNAFKDCSQLKSVSFHNRSMVKIIGEYAFSGSGITSITLPATTDNIGDCAFYNTVSLAEIDLNEGLKEIGARAFNLSGTGETTITVPSTIISIGMDAFKDSNISRINVSDICAWCNIEFANEYANPLTSGSLCQNGEIITSLVIPNRTPEIKKYTLYNASSLMSVHIGNGPIAIGDQAFSGCTGLSAVTLPPSVETIGASAFARDSNLATIAMGHSVKSIGEMAFDGCPATTVSITAQTPPSASNNTFSRYSGKFYVQGEQTADAYYDSYTCWDRFDPELLTEPTGIDINSKTIEGKPGDTFRLTATLQPQNVSLPQIFWSSSNPEIATVDENGLVTIHKTPAEAALAAEGQEASSCKITAESLYADCPVAVVEVVDKIAGIDDVTTDSEDGIDFSAPLEIFTMQGMAVGRDINRLSKGIYIVRQGSTVRKIVIK